MTRAESYITFRDNSRTEFDVTIRGNSPDIITRMRRHFGPLNNELILVYVSRNFRFHAYSPTHSCWIGSFNSLVRTVHNLLLIEDAVVLV